jgi:hypothetical protein
MDPGPSKAFPSFIKESFEFTESSEQISLAWSVEIFSHQKVTIDENMWADQTFCQNYLT